MNLKEAFRYQTFLHSLMEDATNTLTQTEVALKTVRTHLKSKANPDTEDVVEPSEGGEPLEPDDIIAFVERLITERDKLTRAIGEAKCGLIKEGTDLDAATEVNKFRQTAAKRTRAMLRMKASKRVECGTGYKFNAEGVQSPYHYDVEVETTERFDRDKAKVVALRLLTEADKASADIDSAMINTKVAYEVPWQVNESFEDIIAAFIAEHDKEQPAN